LTTSLTVLAPSALPLLRRDDYDSVIKRFNIFLAGRTANEETIREFFKSEKRTYKARSIQVHKCAIKAAVYKAFPTHDTRIKAGMDEIFKSIKIPKPEPRIQSKDLFSKKEIRTIIKASPLHIGLFIQTLYDTGARVSEALSMEYRNCEETPGAVLCKITGKGSKEGALTLTKKLFQQIKKVFGGKVFLFEHGGKVYGRQHMWATCQKFGKIATGRKIHPHSLRHSRITHMIKDGLPLGAVSRFARHSNVTTTLQFYEHNILDESAITRGAL